jgi:hypothetical protein
MFSALKSVLNFELVVNDSEKSVILVLCETRRAVFFSKFSVRISIK